MYLGIAWMIGFTVIRHAPGTPNRYFNSITQQFSCNTAGEFINDTLLLYCGGSMFNISDVANYNDSCTNCDISCSYGANGTTTASDLNALCTQNNNCIYGTINNFQVNEEYIKCLQ